MTERFLNDKVELYCGDCLDILPTLAENSIEAAVTDPPYHLTSIVKRFGKESNLRCDEESPSHGKGPFKRHARGFMGKQWDGGDIAFRPDVWREVYRVLKPGAHLLAFGGTRTYHRLASAIEDAGFEIRDCIQWLYGSGFPKSHDVSKGVDRAAGAERKIIGVAGKSGSTRSCMAGDFAGGEYMATAPATDAAREWEGWGTALKPACEMIVLARRPLSEKTVAANVLRWGTGALNIDGCRVAAPEGLTSGGMPTGGNNPCFMSKDSDPRTERANAHAQGRWPANLIHDGSEEVLAGFPESGPPCGSAKQTATQGTIAGSPNAQPGSNGAYVGDTGNASRYFYTAKADDSDRLGSRHPTVKPLDLMQYLCRLVCKRGGTVLDPFSGTGTTGEAAWREGMHAVLIEREAEYQAEIRRRMSHATDGPDQRAYGTAREKERRSPPLPLPLFE